jgi:glycerol-3-phosphate cytidylyltransferase-like family protein
MTKNTKHDWDSTTKQLESIRLQFIPEGKDASKEIKDHNYKLRQLCINIGHERYKMAKFNKLVL